MGTITVRWMIRDGQVKGSIVEDQDKRGKIVFVERNFRGRQPDGGEVTKASVVKDTKPEDKNKGALLVTPIYGKPANALTEEAARIEMLKLIRGGKYLSWGYIDVDLPGWKGQLEGRAPERRSERGWYYLNWKFQHEDGLVLYLYEGLGGHQTGIVVTTGIRVGDGPRYVSDWAQVVKDLGEPIEITGEDNFRKYAKWASEQGGSIEVELKEEVAMRAGYTIHNVQVTSNRYVTGDVHLLGGRWVITAQWLGSPERMGVDGEISPAKFDSGRFTMTDAIKAQVAELLQKSLHSAEWHQQYLIGRLLNEHSKDDLSLWGKIHGVESKLADPLFPAEKLGYELQWTREIYTRTFDDLTKVATAVPKAVGERNPAIYAVAIADDSAEVQRLTAENQAMIERVNRKMVELTSKVREQTKKFVSQDTMLVALEVFEGLKVRLNAAIEEYNQKDEPVPSYLTYELEKVQKLIVSLQDVANCNVMFLERLHYVRDRVEEMLKPR